MFFYAKDPPPPVVFMPFICSGETVTEADVESAWLTAAPSAEHSREAMLEVAGSASARAAVQKTANGAQLTVTGRGGGGIHPAMSMGESGRNLTPPQIKNPVFFWGGAVADQLLSWG